MSNNGSPVNLMKFQMPPKLMLLISSGSRKKESRYTCLSEAKASHSQRMWAEFTSLSLCTSYTMDCLADNWGGIGSYIKIGKHLGTNSMFLDLFRLNSIWRWVKVNSVATVTVDNIFYFGV